MIISASRRTDIPAFYSDWFINRIREGYALVRNPFDARIFSRVDLTCAAVDAIVFWTKNARPMIAHLDELDQKGYRYYFQYTLNGYPPILEPGVPSPPDAVAAFQDLSHAIGSRRVLWRFDPIVVSDATPEEWIYNNFSDLSGQLQGFTQRASISFADFYTKVKRNLSRTTERSGVKFHDIHKEPEKLKRIASRLAEIANRHSMEIYSCAEAVDLQEVGIARGQCISDELIWSLFGVKVSGEKDKYQRKACRCVGSRDIGQYDTCAHGCVYCYANAGREAARRNHGAHDPKGPAIAGGGGAGGPSGESGRLL